MTSNQSDDPPKFSEYETEWSKRGYEPHIATLLAKADWSEDMINWQEDEINRLRNDLQNEIEAGGSRERGTSPNRSCGTAGQSGPASSLLKGLRHNECKGENDPWLREMCGDAADEIERLQERVDDLLCQLAEKVVSDSSDAPQFHRNEEGDIDFGPIATHEPAAVHLRASEEASFTKTFANSPRRIPEPPGDDPNEGPVVNGLVQVSDGVLPAFYNQWKCSQCGRDPRDVRRDGCGYSQSCGRTAETKEGNQAGQSPLGDCMQAPTPRGSLPNSLGTPTFGCIHDSVASVPCPVCHPDETRCGRCNVDPCVCISC